MEKYPPHVADGCFLVDEKLGEAEFPDDPVFDV